MLCYKEVRKYNGNYYSRFDNGYVYKLGEIASPSNDDFIYATDTIENVLMYAYVDYDMAIIEMEIVDGTEYVTDGYIVKAKAVRVLREVGYEEYNKCRKNIFTGESTAELYSLLQARKQSILCDLSS